jgi:hypothetical protein
MVLSYIRIRRDWSIVIVFGKVIISRGDREEGSMG